MSPNTRLKLEVRVNDAAQPGFSQAATLVQTLWAQMFPNDKEQ